MKKHIKEEIIDTSQNDIIKDVDDCVDKELEKATTWQDVEPTDIYGREKCLNNI